MMCSELQMLASGNVSYYLASWNAKAFYSTSPLVHPHDVIAHLQGLAELGQATLGGAVCCKAGGGPPVRARAVHVEDVPPRALVPHHPYRLPNAPHRRNLHALRRQLPCVYISARQITLMPAASPICAPADTSYTYSAQPAQPARAPG